MKRKCRMERDTCRNKQHTPEKQIRLQMYLVLFLYTVMGIVLVFVLQFLCSKFNNGFFMWLYWRR